MTTENTNPAAPAASATPAPVPSAPAPAAPAPKAPVTGFGVPPTVPFTGKGRKNRQPKVQK